MNSLTDEQWNRIDDRILACDILGALALIRESCGEGLSKAKDIHWERYQFLRSTKSADFKCSHDDYWAGVYG